MKNDKNTFGICKRSHPVKPLQVVIKNQSMEIIKEKNNLTKQINRQHGNGECEDWQIMFYIAQTNCKHLEGGYGRLPLGNVYICHGFIPRMGKFEKVGSRTFFYKLIEEFVDGGFGNSWEPPFNRIYGA